MFWIGTAVGTFVGAATAIFVFSLWILRDAIWPRR